MYVSLCNDPETSTEWNADSVTDKNFFPSSLALTSRIGSRDPQLSFKPQENQQFHLINSKVVAWNTDIRSGENPDPNEN